MTKTNRTKTNRQGSRLERTKKRLMASPPFRMGSKMLFALISLCREFYTARTVLLADRSSHRHKLGSRV